MLGRRMHRSPSFQLSVLLPDPVRNPRVIGLCPLSVRDRVPTLCSGVLAEGDIEYGDGGREDEAFEGRVLAGGLEDGERPVIAGSIIVFEGGEPDNGSFGRGCKQMGALEVESNQERCQRCSEFAFRGPNVASTSQKVGWLNDSPGDPLINRRNHKE